MKRRVLIAGEPVLPGYDGTMKDWLLFLLPLFLFSLCLSMLYLGMRGVMELGGFVATGGPYEIAHEAPKWVWIFPVSINVMVISMIASGTLGKKIRGPNLMSLSWSALFISLGWNFTEYGIKALKEASTGIPWIICAVLFMIMGFLPLVIIVMHFVEGLKEREVYPNVMPWKGKVIIQAVTAAGGVYLGISFFSHL